MIGDIHRRFLEAGADIVETNTFSATSIGQSEFFVDDPREHGGKKDAEFYDKILSDPRLNDLAWEINVESARQCREWADQVGSAPTARGASWPAPSGRSPYRSPTPPDADDAGFRVVTFDQVRNPPTRTRSARFIAGLGRTCSSSRPSLRLAQREGGDRRHRGGIVDEDGITLPIMISAAVGRGGETMISAQTGEALWNAVEHVEPISIGLNCSLGPDLMYPFLTELSEKSGAAISCYPNAGLPNPLSPTGFDLVPADMGRFLGDFARGGLINIAGGCCGNTPEHIAAIAKALEHKEPRVARTARAASAGEPLPPTDFEPLRLSGSQPFTQQEGVYIMIGERTNVAEAHRGLQSSSRKPSKKR